MDYMFFFPSTKHGNDCVFVVVDKFSKMAILVACKKSIIAEATTKLYFERVWVDLGSCKPLYQIGKAGSYMILVKPLVIFGHQVYCIPPPN